MPKDLPHAFEFIVIGAGLGGSVVAAQLGRAGHDVLVIERGRANIAPAPRSNSKRAKVKNKLLPNTAPFPPARLPQMMSASISRDGRPARVEELPAVLGIGPGGASRLYAAALSRMSAEDFSDDTGSPTGAMDNRWPFGADEIRPYYEAAEQLMRVRGSEDPTDPDAARTTLLPPPAISPRDRGFIDQLRANGHMPFRQHAGIDYLPGCAECFGRPCPRGCKATGASRALNPALAEGKLHLASALRVTKIEQHGDGMSVLVEDPDGQPQRFDCEHVILAAGALKTPGILAASPDIWPKGQPHAMLGRGLMFHCSEIIAVSDPEERAQFGPQKTICLRDFYREGQTPLGEVQSLGIPISTGTITQFLIDEARRRGFGWLGPFLQLARIPAAFGAKMFEHATLFATILEDLPYEENRVVIDGPDPDKIEISYTIHAELKTRAKRLRELIKGGFAPYPVRFLSPLGTPNWGHSCGTARMGIDPETSVVSPSGQLWDNPSVSVVDASVFPGSGGTNPSLTIVANAIRVADQLIASRQADNLARAASASRAS